MRDPKRKLAPIVSEEGRGAKSVLACGACLGHNANKYRPASWDRAWPRNLVSGQPVAHTNVMRNATGLQANHTNPTKIVTEMNSNHLEERLKTFTTASRLFPPIRAAYIDRIIEGRRFVQG